ncbi:MAG: RnfABCDGE type electron transport complex subunit B [Ruminococcaceae bacterium]|nr:RnfABCDGE type electron transport complex subunit B [Oscillospiraceae bacterium]
MIEQILYPALAVGAIGLFLGGLLAVASIVFRVETDERVEQIAEILPGANCGGCGYAGCSAFAKAIVEDGAPINRCNLMTAETAEKIAGIMGVEAGVITKKVARVACRGTAECAGDQYVSYGLNDCVAAAALGGGPKACAYGCMGLGSCVSVCQFGAISVVDGVAAVDEDACTGCGACASVCPKNVIAMVDADSRVFVGCSSRDKGAVVKTYCEVGCIGCKICEKKCEFGAISVVDNVAVIDPEKCTNCGVCASACLKKIIVTDVCPVEGESA